MERDPSLENPPIISDQEINILRLLGKGNSLIEISHSERGARSKLRNVYQIFGVTGITAAVVSALDNGFLKTSELIEEDFDWSLFNNLNPVEMSILEAFMHAKGENLNEEEWSRLSITTSQDPTDYVWHSITAIREELGLNSKRETIIYYYAFRERQQKQVDVIVPAAREILTNKEVQVLEWLSQGLSPSVIANNRWVETVKTHTIYVHTGKILAKLGVKDIKAAAVKARELGILKS